MDVNKANRSEASKWERFTFGILFLLTSGDFVGVHHAQHVQQSRPHQELRAVIVNMARDVRLRVSQPDCEKVKNSAHHVAEKTADVNDRGEQIAGHGTEQGAA